MIRLLLLAIYVFPVFRFLRCLLSKQLKQQIIRRDLFLYGCTIHGLLSLINVAVVVVVAFDGLAGANNVPFAYISPVQFLLIIVAEVFIAKSKKYQLE